MRLGWVALLLLAGCSAREEKPAPPSADAAQTVVVARIALQPLAAAISVSGTLVPCEEVTVAPELAGYRVLRVRVEEAAQIARGTLLAEMDTALIDGEVARARVAAARAVGEADRVAGLEASGTISDEVIAQRRFDVASSRVQLADLETRRARLSVRAPVSGTILARTVKPGDISSSGGEPWFRIARDGLIELAADVPEDVMMQLRPGLTATVTLADGSTLAGQVRLIGSRVNAQTRLGQVRLRLPADARLRDGGAAQARLDLAAVTVPSIPEKALIYGSGGVSLAVVGKDMRVRIVPVETGRRARGLVELRKGPPVGTQAILGAGSLVLPGDKVRIARAAP